MKKAIALALALVVCLSLCACDGGNDVPETQVPTTIETTTVQTEQTEPKTTEEPTRGGMTKGEAENIAREYTKYGLGYMRFKSEVSLSISNADSFSSFSINKCTTEEKENCYDCTFTGTFFAKDEYGKNLGQYCFTWEVSVSKWSREVIGVGSITISK